MISNFSSRSRVFTVLPAGGVGGVDGARVSSEDYPDGDFLDPWVDWEVPWALTEELYGAHWDSDSYFTPPSMTITVPGVYWVWTCGTVTSDNNDESSGWITMDIVRNGTEIVASCMYDWRNFLSQENWVPDPVAFAVLACEAGDVFTVVYCNRFNVAIDPGGWETGVFGILKIA